MFSTITNANFSKSDFISLVTKGIEHREALRSSFEKAYSDAHGSVFSEAVPECASWTFTDENDLLAKAQSGSGGWLEIVDEDERSLKATIQYGLKGLCAYAEHAYQLNKKSREIFEYLMEALASPG